MLMVVDTSLIPLRGSLFLTKEKSKGKAMPFVMMRFIFFKTLTYKRKYIFEKYFLCFENSLVI